MLAVLSCLACPIFIRLKICGSRITVWAAIYVKRFFATEQRGGKEDYLNLIEQLDEEGFDDFTRVRELLGLATGSDNVLVHPAYR